MSDDKRTTKKDLSAEFQRTQLELEASWEQLVEAQDRLDQATSEVKRIQAVIASWVHEIVKV